MLYVESIKILEGMGEKKLISLPSKNDVRFAQRRIAQQQLVALRLAGV